MLTSIYTYIRIKENQLCNINGGFIDILKMKKFYIQNDSLYGENEFLQNGLNNTNIGIDNKKDGDSFFSSSYFDIIVVVMISSVLLMIIVVWFYGCGIRDDKKVKKRRRREYPYPNFSSIGNNERTYRSSKEKYVDNIYNDSLFYSLTTDTNEPVNHNYHHNHQRNKSYSGFQNYNKYERSKRNRHHSYNGYDFSERREYERQKQLKKHMRDSRMSRMSMRDSYSNKGSIYHNHYNKKVEVTGSGDYTPPGYLELIWMAFSSVLDVTTDIWYAESLFAHNLEIHYNNIWIFQIMSIIIQIFIRHKLMFLFFHNKEIRNKNKNKLNMYITSTLIII